MPVFNNPYRLLPRDPAPVSPTAQPQPAVGRGGLAGWYDNALAFRNDNPGLLTRAAAALGPSNRQAGLSELSTHLMQQGGQKEIAQYLVDNGYANNLPEAMVIARNQALLSDKLKGSTTLETYQAKRTILQDMGIDENSPEGRAYLMSGSASGGTTYGKTPIWGEDENGNKVLGVIGDDGTFKTLDTGGVEPLSPIQEIKTATEVIGIDRHTGQELFRRPLNLGEAERQKVFGKELADLQVVTATMEAGFPNLEATVNDLSRLAEEATFSVSGKLWDDLQRAGGWEPGQDAEARAAYLSRVSNTVLPLLKETFGAAFTNLEGERLAATLGDINLGPREKQAQLQQFIIAKKQAIENRKAAIAAIMEEYETGNIREGGGGEPEEPLPRKTVTRNGRDQTFEEDPAGSGNWYPVD